MKNLLFIASQHCLPTNGISRALGWLAERNLGPVTQYVIRWFIKRYGVEMREALHSDPKAYKTFNAFFTRQLAPGARALPKIAVPCISPVDGKLYASGGITRGQMYQAKGKHYTAAALIGNEETAQDYLGHSFACIYLSPKDYHRIHCPMEATLVKTRFIPGKLFSVNPVTTQHINHLFSRNERLVCHFETAHGPMILVFVGAMVVGSIKTAWSGVVYSKTIQEWDHKISFRQGDELGCFQLGSTVILLLPKPVQLLPIGNNSPLVLGQALSAPEIKT